MNQVLLCCFAEAKFSEWNCSSLHPTVSLDSLEKINGNKLDNSMCLAKKVRERKREREVFI